ncbi:MAG: guanylate kinase, partial [Acidimicrobiia bacterium]
MRTPGRLFVVSGPSGSGKSSLITAILREADVDFSVSATTRYPRPGEIDGRHYHFVTRKQFEEMIENGELLEWAEYNNHLYGTPGLPIADANARGRDVLLDIEIKGARQVKEARPDAIMVFIAAPSMEELEKRLRARGDTSDDDIADRLEIASSQLAEAGDVFDHILVNDRFELAVEELLTLIT